jgi:hypothetical protein
MRAGVRGWVSANKRLSPTAREALYGADARPESAAQAVRRNVDGAYTARVTNEARRARA